MYKMTIIINPIDDDTGIMPLHKQFGIKGAQFTALEYEDLLDGFPEEVKSAIGHTKDLRHVQLLSTLIAKALLLRSKYNNKGVALAYPCHTEENLAQVEFINAIDGFLETFTSVEVKPI